VRLPAWTALLLVALLTAPAARADQIDDGSQQFHNARVTGFEDGQIVFRGPDGRSLRADLKQVRRIYVDHVGGMDDFNAAEQYAFEGDDARASARYERAERFADGFWVDVIRARLVLSYDRLERIDKTVFHYLRLLEGGERGPLLAASFMPTFFPPERTAESVRAVSQLDTAVGRIRNEEGRALAMLVRFELLRRAGDARAVVSAETIARLRLPAAIRNARTYAIQTAALQAALEADPPGEAFVWLNQAIRDADDGVVPDLLLLKGRALLKTAKSDDDVIRAGWAFMRVVVHYPRDVRAAQALYDAARVHERIGRPQKAIALLKECLQRGDAPPALKTEAQQALSRLGGA